MRVLRNSARGFAVLIGTGLAASLLAFSAPSAHAQQARVATPGTPVEQWTVETTKGRRPGNKPYFVEFRSRAAATYGHMYVLYGRVNGRDEIVKSRIAGLHPAGDAANCYNCSLFNWTVGHVVFVPAETGASDGDLEEKYVTARFRVWLTRAQYRELDGYIRKLQADSPLWNALWNNCVAFGRNIAEHLGLKVPFTIWMEPADFVTAMREMNGLAKEQLPLRDAGVSRPRSSASRVPPLPPQKPKQGPAAQPEHPAAVSTLPKPAPVKPKKPVVEIPTVRAVASSESH